MWQVDNLLDAPTYSGEYEPHTLSIDVEDKPGVLNQARGPPGVAAHAPPRMTLLSPPGDMAQC